MAAGTAAVTAYSDNRPSLLIVDDERGPAESLRMIFKTAYNVLLAEGGEQALEIVHSTPVDVVTLDLRMPMMSGIEVMERIKAHDPAIEVIVVTGYSSLDTAIRGLRFGAFDYVSKPFDVPHISNLVHRAVERRRNNLRQRHIKEDFLANLSHELRTPLSAIIGYSTILADELDASLTPDQRSAFERIQVNSLELLNLVEGVMLLNSLDAGEVGVNFRQFDLGAMLRRVTERFEPLAIEKGLLFRCDLETNEPSVAADEEKIERILRALVDNAIKFTSQGVVAVSVRRAPNRDAIELEVSDTGIGMHNEDLGRALEGLTQADPSTRRRFRGLGLGLRTATRLVKMLGGEIHVHSRVDQGSRFLVDIPLPVSPAGQALH